MDIGPIVALNSFALHGNQMKAMQRFFYIICDAIILLLGSIALVKPYEKVYTEVYRGLQRYTEVYNGFHCACGTINVGVSIVTLKVVTLKGLRVS